MAINLVSILLAAGWVVGTVVAARLIGSKPITVWNTIVGGHVAALGVALGCVVLLLSPFGFVHVAYVVATLGPALLALSAAIGIWRGWFADTPAAKGFVAILVVPGLVGLWATHIAPFDLKFEEETVELPCERSGTDPIRIGVLADIQTPTIGDYEREAVQRVMDADPDLIVIAGDIQQGDDPDYSEFNELFASMSAPHGVYVVQGDVDRIDEMDTIVSGTGVVWLHNEIVSLSIGDRTVLLGGNEREYYSISAVEMHAELGAAPGEVITLVLTHRPDPALVLGGSVDLVMAGHTHGGQIAIPFLGPLHVASDVPRKVGAGGLHELDGQQIYVSSGVGMERLDAPQVRLFSPPSIGLLTLETPASCAS
ncbi:MAG: hypothetical protein GY925_02365 [Actinomycetia bacterium]|nr:hypothetical protein [Actinomycetes bacterium]